LSFLPQKLEDGSPNPLAAWVNAMLGSCLYENRQDIAQIYADAAGAEIKAWVRNPTTYEPDYLILISGKDALVIFAGTTNAPQWLGHAASAIVPAVDLVIDEYVLASFYYGLLRVELAIRQVLATADVDSVKLSGDSYGGSAAFIFARHVRVRQGPNFPIDLMTFGEPKSFGGARPGNQPDSHNRFVAVQFLPDPGVGHVWPEDPIPLTPPNNLELIGFAWPYKIAKLLLFAEWRHFGRR